MSDKSTYYYGAIATDLGKILLTFNKKKELAMVHFIEEDEVLPATMHHNITEIQHAIIQLKEYFSGSHSAFTIPLQPEGTNFQKKVWNELTKIPFGKTVSYQVIANRLGDPKVIRAAASANGKNPIAILIPCHRVIGSDGSLTGYSGGLHRKKWLLAHENPIKQISLF